MHTLGGEDANSVRGTASSGPWSEAQRGNQENRRSGAAVPGRFDVSLAYGMPKPSAKRMTWATAASACSSWT